MKLYVIRHAIATERHLFAQTGKSDSQRPLTDKGIERMNGVLEFLKTNETQIDCIMHSPYKRCTDTAALVHDFYPESLILETQNLQPDHSAQNLFEQIIKQQAESIAIIGHEPDLGQFISWLLFRQATDHFPIKKSGIAKLDLYQDGRAYLKWMVSPKLVTE